MAKNKTNPALIGVFVLLALAMMIAAIVYYSANLFSHNKQTYNIMFRTNTAGLDISAPVVLQGVKIGEVTDIVVGFNHQLDKFEVQTTIVIDRNKVRWPKQVAHAETATLRRSLIEKGLRAKLAMHSLITGKLMVQIAFYPGSELTLAGLDSEIPSLSSGSLNKFLQDIAALDINKINHQIETLYTGLERLLSDAQQLINGMDQIFNNGKIAQIENEVLLTLKEVRITLDDVNNQITPLSSNLNGVIVNTQQLINKVDANIDEVSQSVIYAGNEAGDLSKLLKNNIIPIMNSLQSAANDIDSMIKKGSPLRVELLTILRNLNKTVLSLNDFVDYLERHPEVLLKGKR